MAYTKQTWVDNNLSYPVSAARMTTIENGIEAAALVADNFRIAATAPASPTVGQMWYDSTTGTLREWNGSAWRMVASPSASNGGVLQVAQAVKTDTYATTAGAQWADVPSMSVSITPKSTSNKVLVLVDVKMNGTPSASVVRSRLVRNSTAIYTGDAASNRPGVMCQFYGGNTGSDGHYFTMGQTGGMFLDSPATTSATTYKIQIGGDSNALLLYVNRTQQDRDTTYYDGRAASSITLLEIAA